MVVGEGFEPSKAKPADLQSALVDHLSTLPKHKLMNAYGNRRFNEARIVPDMVCTGKHKKSGRAVFSLCSGFSLVRQRLSAESLARSHERADGF